MKLKQVNGRLSIEKKIKNIRILLRKYLLYVIKSVFIKLSGKMSLASHGLDVIKNLFSNKEDLKIKQKEITTDISEKTLELQTDVKVNNLGKEVNDAREEKSTNAKIDIKNKIVKDSDLIDTSYEKNMCSADAQRKAKQYFGVNIPGGDGSALKTRNSYDKTSLGKNARYISYEKIDTKNYKSMSTGDYINHMEDYFHSMSGNFFDILMESKTSPRYGHRAIGFRGTDDQIYVIDNAAKNTKMRSGAVPLSYYIKNFVTHGYRINGIGNYDTSYAYNVDPNSYVDNYSNVA